MLDTDTKRRIDTARDILVGKVPDPKSQVEQITIALIKTEQALVAANRELIERFEKKIQATLARVWGEDEPSPAEE
jgi:type I restriction enzyme M protein